MEMYSLTQSQNNAFMWPPLAFRFRISDTFSFDFMRTGARPVALAMCGHLSNYN